MIIAAIVRYAKSVTGWRGLKAAPGPICAPPTAGVTVDVSVTLDVPQHDPIVATASVSAPPIDHDQVPGRLRRFVSYLWHPVGRRPTWGRIGMAALVFLAIQFIMASPAARSYPAPDAPGLHGWFPVVLISVNGEPKHPIAPGFLPDVFYADRTSCLKGTRAGVGEMARAGIRGDFLCMYPREPDEELSRGPQEAF